MTAFTQAPAQTDAQVAFEAQLPAYRRAAPDEILVRLRQRVTALVSPLPGFDPGGRMVDLVLEQTWPTLRRRCPVSTPLGATAAIALADDMLREGRVPRASAADRGSIAAMLAALDGRICRCAQRPSLALAADCAS